jgi:hypothetical protein
MDVVLQHSLPFAPWADPRTRRLPGMLPLDMGDWLRVDDAYAGQMRLREALTTDRPDAVHTLLPEGRAAAEELYATVAAALPALGFRATGDGWQRPDGAIVRSDPAAPLLTLGRLVQEDFCILQKPEGTDEHVMTAAILCFPAGWTLAEKIGRPLMRIHLPVEKYDGDIGQRVQRLFDAIRPGAPMWRANAHYSAAPLFNPRSEAAPRLGETSAAPRIRSERQCLVRLPVTGAVVFSIHTYLVTVADLTPDQKAALDEHPIHVAP